MDDIIGPSLVVRLDVKLAAEFRRFEINIIEADEFCDLVEETFRPHKQRLERQIAFDYNSRKNDDDASADALWNLSSMFRNDSQKTSRCLPAISPWQTL